MSQNIEIKAKLPNFVVFEHIYKLLNLKTKSKGNRFVQRDTFFYSSKGILKLREQNGKDRHANLMFYERTDGACSKQCYYTRSPVQDPRSMKEILSKTLGKRGEVTKERLFYHVGQIRIHLDKVEGLGYFIELEVMTKPDQSREEGIGVAEDLLIELKVDASWLQTHAYMDLIETNEVAKYWK